MKAFFTVKEIAEYFSISEDKVRELARKKQLPCKKIGKEWRFPIKSIEYMQQCETIPVSTDIKKKVSQEVVPLVYTYGLKNRNIIK